VRLYDIHMFGESWFGYKCVIALRRTAVECGFEVLTPTNSGAFQDCFWWLLVGLITGFLFAALLGSIFALVWVVAGQRREVRVVHRRRAVRTRFATAPTGFVNHQPGPTSGGLSSIDSDSDPGYVSPAGHVRGGTPPPLLTPRSAGRRITVGARTPTDPGTPRSRSDSTATDSERKAAKAQRVAAFNQDVYGGIPRRRGTASSSQ
jgi:hypothetical protein